MKIAKKRPALKWKPYQTRRPPDAYVRRWFARPNRGIAVIFGEPSGYLGSRDFDDIASYQLWAKEFPALAEILPTVETRRGKHVYFTYESADMADLRQSIGNDGNGAISCGDGELRAGSGCYSLLPPSKHPKGHIYRWLTPPDDVPIVDIRASGLFKKRLVTESTEWDGGVQRFTEVIGVEWWRECEEIEVAINGSQPRLVGQRRDSIFDFCRALKGIPYLADAKPKELKPIIREWHSKALPVIGTKPFEQTYADFVAGWKCVKYPKGQDPMSQIWAKAMRSELPAVAFDYDCEQVRRLVGLCRELQRVHDPKPFFLSCRTAGELFNISHTEASRWLHVLIADEVIEEVSKGSRETGKASRYRYLGAMEK